MPRLKHDKTGMTYACPACDGAVIYERTGNGNTDEHPDRPFRCENPTCGVSLTFVIERPKKSHNPTERQTYLPTLGKRRDIKARELAARGPEDYGLSPIGVRSGQP